MSELIIQKMIADEDNVEVMKELLLSELGISPETYEALSETLQTQLFNLAHMLYLLAHTEDRAFHSIALQYAINVLKLTTRKDIVTAIARRFAFAQAVEAYASKMDLVQ